MKNRRSWHRADQAEEEWDSRSDALFMLLSDEFPPFQTVCGSLQRRVQMVYDFSEKSRFSLRFN
jgi:hypothetical protein